MRGKPVLDPASGSRMFYFDSDDPRVVFGDIRSESHTLCDGRALGALVAHVEHFRWRLLQDLGVWTDGGGAP